MDNSPPLRLFVQDDATPVVAGTCRSFLIIMFSSIYTIVINLWYVFQNIHIMYERFLTISYSRIKDTGRVDDLMWSETKL